MTNHSLSSICMPVATPTVNGTANVSYGTATLDAHNFNEAIRLRAVHTPTFPLGDRGGALIGFGHASLLTGTIHGSSSRDTPVVPPSFFVAIAGPHAPHRRVLDGERIVATSHNESGVLPGNEP